MGFTSTFSKYLAKMGISKPKEPAASTSLEAPSQVSDATLRQSPTNETEARVIEEMITYTGGPNTYDAFNEAQRKRFTGNVFEDWDLSSQLPTNTDAMKPGQEDTITGQSQEAILQPPAFVCKQTESCPCSLPGPGSTASLYQSLPSDNHFRLLEILPGRDGDIECRMYIAHLINDQNSYEALSYTWQESRYESSLKLSNSIRCNEQILPVGKNLHAALERLRDTKNSRIIWADALCINQDDKVEQGQQVRKMGNIFASAIRVIIWLGKYQFRGRSRHQYGPCMAFGGICRVVNAWRGSSDLSDSIPEASYFPNTATDDDKNDFSRSHYMYPLPVLEDGNDVWSDITTLFKTRWFSRVWVIQEAALAREAIVQWGKYQISFEWIGIAAALFRTNYTRIAKAEETVPAGIINAYFIYRLSKCQRHSTPLKFTFYEILKLTRQFGCKDDRDRIFGLLGLPMTDNVSSTIVPDYTKPVAELYLLIAQQVIRENWSLNILSSVQRPSHDEIMWAYSVGAKNWLNEKAPSWVPSGTMEEPTHYHQRSHIHLLQRRLVELWSGRQEMTTAY